jgi:hypothetical protein
LLESGRWMPRYQGVLLGHGPPAGGRQSTPSPGRLPVLEQRPLARAALHTGSCPDPWPSSLHTIVFTMLCKSFFCLAVFMVILRRWICAKGSAMVGVYGMRISTARCSRCGIYKWWCEWHLVEAGALNWCHAISRTKSWSNYPCYWTTELEYVECRVNTNSLFSIIGFHPTTNIIFLDVNQNVGADSIRSGICNRPWQLGFTSSRLAEN